MKNKYWKLTIKFLLYSLISLISALAATVLIYYATYKMFDLPGGRYYLSFVYNRLREFILEMPWLLWGCMTILLLLAFYALLTRTTTKRLARIENAVSQICKGDYHVLLPNDKTDSLGVLERNINAMAVELESYLRDQKELERSKDDFIVNIAHDLRTPLTSIVGYLSFLTERDLNPEISAKYAAIAYKKSKQLEILVESLFDVANFTMGSVTINKEKVNLKKLLMQKQDEMFPQLHRAGMEICLDVPEALPLVAVDGGLMARAFDNLITNAIRYAYEGRTLDIRVVQNKDSVLVSLITHANPVPSSELEHIFDKFYRLETSRAEHTGGVGLGLSISRRIVELHGGTLTARQTEDGTAFDICLPI